MKVRRGLADKWRDLPTAWIHFAIVECSAIWAALGSWVVLVGQIQTTTSLGNRDTEAIMAYFQSLFFLGTTGQQNVTFSGVQDDFFVNNLTANPIDFYATYVNEKLSHCTLVLPATSLRLQSTNAPWLVLAWVLPAAAVVLVVYKLAALARSGIWSFESMAYLEFTEETYSSRNYKIGSSLMALGPLGLLLLWVVQIIVYELHNQLNALLASLPALCVLIVAIKTICFPWVRGQHFHMQAPSNEFLKLRVKRTLMHFNPANASAHNAIWSLNLMRALMLAKMEHYNAMKVHMFVDWDADNEMSDDECRRVLAICEAELAKDWQQVDSGSEDGSESTLRGSE